MERADLKIQQRGVQWKQGVVIYMALYTSLLYNTAPIHCTPLPLHPPLQSIQGIISQYVMLCYIMLAHIVLYHIVVYYIIDVYYIIIDIIMIVYYMIITILHTTIYRHTLSLMNIQDRESRSALSRVADIMHALL